MTSTAEEINKIINAVIEDEKKLKQYASNSIPISDFIKEAIRQTKAECRIEELEFLKNVHIQLWYYFENGELKILQRELENRIKELQKADEMFKEEDEEDEQSD